MKLLSRRQFCKGMLIAVGAVAGCGRLPRVFDIRSFGASTESSDNSTAIQRALDSATFGDTVFIPRGVWRISFNEFKQWSGLDVPDGITITGVGGESVIAVANETLARSSVFISAGKSHIQFSNFAIDCSFKGWYSGIDARLNAITLIDSNACSVERVKLENGWGYGVWIWGGQNNSVQSCVVRDFQDCIELTGSHSNIVKKNVIECTGVFPTNSGILLYSGSSENSISENVVRGTMGAGLSLYSMYKDQLGRDPFRNTLSSNEVNVSGYGAILCGNENQLSQNVIEAQGYPGIAFWDDSQTRNVTIGLNKVTALFGELREGPYWNPWAVYCRGSIFDSVFHGNDIKCLDRNGVYLRGANIDFSADNVIDAIGDSLSMDLIDLV